LQEYGWCDKPFAEDIAAELGVSPDAVLPDNDCREGANAERRARKLSAGQTSAFMTLSTGFGGGLYNGGAAHC